MRFLETDTLQFVQVPDSEILLEKNNYAILTHRWGADEDEITFDDISSSTYGSNKKGFAKLKNFCTTASSRGFRYGWVDTCCIDKRSTSELAEAIRSMYHWYEGSSFCVAYLEDVPRRDFVDSEWFDRGWTLQELISPKDVSFFDHDWELLGTKRELLATLSLKTRIPGCVLSHAAKPSSCSVAQRMSWAAERKTTRVEDRAYSLIGLFGVSVTPAYGEREKAFLRLQQAIVLASKDESLFAWAMENDAETTPYSGLYATSPAAFIDCRSVYDTRGSSGFTEANGEVLIRLGTYPYRMESYFAVLNCAEDGRSDNHIAILLTRLPTDGEYVRIKNSVGVSRMRFPNLMRNNLKERQIRVPVDPMEPPLNMFYGFWLRTLEPPNHDRCQPIILSHHQPPDADSVCLGEYSAGTAGVVLLQRKDTSKRLGWSNIRWIKLGFDAEFNPVLLIANDRAPEANFERPSLLYRPRQTMFERAVDTGPGSPDHQQIMDNSWINAKAGIPNRLAGWPSGVSILEVDRKKGISGALKALNLSISVQLIPYCKPTQLPVERADGSGLPLMPMKIWTVDITDTGGSAPESDHSCTVWCNRFDLCVALFAAIVMMPCFWQAADQRNMEINEARSRIGRLVLE